MKGGTMETQQTTNESPLDAADKKIKAMTELSAKLEEQINKLADVEARRLLGGQTHAGGTEPEKPKPSAKEYALAALGNKVI